MSYDLFENLLLTQDEDVTSQNLQLKLSASGEMAGKKEDHIGYMVRLEKDEKGRYFAGSVAIPANMSSKPANLFNRLNALFNKSNPSRVSDMADLKEKYKTALISLKNKDVDTMVKNKLEENRQWTLLEVENWLGIEEDSGSGGKKKENENKKADVVNEVSIAANVEIEKEVVQVKMRNTVFEVSEKFIEEVLTELDLADEELTKHDFARMGLKLLPILIRKNDELEKKVKEQEKTIRENYAEAFDRNTREMLLRKDLEERTKKRDEKEEKPEGQMSMDQFNQIMKKLEEVHKEVVSGSQKSQDILEKSNENKLNMEKVVTILGNRNLNLSCKVKILKLFESSTYNIVFFGSKSALKPFQAKDGDLRKDLESLQRKSRLTWEETEKTGIENLTQLMKSFNVKEGMPSAVVVLNITEETAECIMMDDEMAEKYADQSKSHCQFLLKVAKGKFGKVFFILPPSSTKSHMFTRKISKVLLDEVENIHVVDTTNVQEKMGEDREENEIWEVDNKKLLKSFTDEEQEGWNNFSSNAALSTVLGDLLEKEVEYCKACGVDHGQGFPCQNEKDKSKDYVEDKKERERNESSLGGDKSEECLKCFNTHTDRPCYVTEKVLCKFEGCFRSGHLKTVHYPKKEGTAERLRSKYGEVFPLVLSQKRYLSSDGKGRDWDRDRERDRDRDRDGKRLKGGR